MDDSEHGGPLPVSGQAHGDGSDPGETGGRGPDPGRIVLAVNSVIAAVGGTYASTHSIAATVIAGGAGLACAAVIAWKR